MKPITEKEIRDLLTPNETPTPPAGLAERIKNEIPDQIIFESLDPDEPTGSIRSPLSRPRFLLMAASVVLTLGGSFLAYRLMDQVSMEPSRAKQTVSSTDDDAEPQIETAAPPSEIEGPQRQAPVPQRQSSVPQQSQAASSPIETPALQSNPAAQRIQGSTTEDRARPTAEDEVTEPDRLLDLQDEEHAEGSVKLLETSINPPVELRKSQAAAIAPAPNERTARADRNRSSVIGTITDEQGAGLPGVTVTATSPTLQGERFTVTGSDGDYNLKSLPPGEYKVSYELEGFATKVESNSLSAAQTQESNVEMELAEVIEEIVVTSNLDVISEFAAGAPPYAHDEVEPQPEPRDLAGETSLRTLSGRRANEASRRPAAPAPALATEVAHLTSPSTGGTAEPNDAPYGDVFFRDAGTNPFIDTEDDALSTFGLDVDTASYTVVRRYLRDGHLPPSEAVRVEELINYFDYGDAAPEREDFAIHAEGAPSIYGQGDRHYLLRFNLSGRDIATEDRRPALLTFVVDVSGSMAQENRLGLVKQALALLLDQLRDDDRIALVIYGSRGQVLIEPTGDRNAIRRGIEQLRTGGSTNAEEGLTLAYDLAARHRRQGAINRVILCSDGVANVGNTSAGSILGRIRREADQGIELTTVGFGMGNYNDVLMERLADDGNGRYAYVDTLDEARRIFVEDLTGTLQTLAAEARTQVDFNPQVVSRYRLLGYENRDIADERFRDDTVDAGEIGVGHTVTALYEVKLHRKPRQRDKIATLHLRYGSIAKREVVEQKRTVTGADFVRRWDDASPALRLTSLVAEFAEILKHSYWAKEGDLEDVFRRAQKVSAELAGDHEVADFVSLVGRASKAWEREAKR